MNSEVFAQSCRTLGLVLSPAQLQNFQNFEDQLYRANAQMNLTRIPQDECWQRHFLDSLLFQDLIPQNAKLLDIGTGPGFPAWPLACARPDLTVTALDSNGKMLGFLKSQPIQNLEVVNARAEEWTEKGKFDVVTGRAVAPISAQLEISAAFAKLGGKVIPMRSPSDLEAIPEINLEPLGLQLDHIEQRELPGTGVFRLFPVYEKIKQTQRGYPRRWAEIKKKPL